MEIGYTTEQEAFRDELRAYYDQLLDEETVEELGQSHGVGEATKRVWKQMCSDGWAGVGWPKEWGGQGRKAIDQFVFFDESMRAGAPVPMLTLNTVGPTIMNYGTDWQKEFFVPKILAGDIHFCIGYSEPQAGTDLAALQCRAVRDGDEYVINGQKMWTSLAGGADYCWLAVRTDPEAKKHKGISVIIVPMDTPGITIQPLHLMGEHDINATFFDDVRVPAKFLIGEENGGWGLITNQLNHERVTLCASGSTERHLTDVRKWAQDTAPARRPPRDRPGVGAAEPGPGARPARVPEARQLEGGVVGGAGQPAPGRRLHREGVRHRVLHGVLPAPHGGPRAACVPQGRRARGHHAQPPRDGHPQLDHPHLRWRHERAAA